MTITLLGRLSLADVERVANFYMRVEAGRTSRSHVVLVLDRWEDRKPVDFQDRLIMR